MAVLTLIRRTTAMKPAHPQRAALLATIMGAPAESLGALTLAVEAVLSASRPGCPVVAFARRV